MTPPSRNHVIRAIREVLPHARAAWLFGSAAHGTVREDSDLDIAVSLAQAVPARDLLDAAQALSERLGMEVDLLDFAHAHTVMQFQILSTGQPLFSDDPVAAAQYAGFVFTEYQHMQAWRRPLMAQLAQRLAGTGAGA